MSDVVLKDDGSVILIGNVGIGTEKPGTKLHVHGASGVTTSGPGAGFVFADRHQNGPFFEWRAIGAKAMLHEADMGDLLTVTLDDRKVHVRGGIHSGGAVSIGTDAPRRQLHVHGDEIHTGGPGAGFSFGDRGADSFAEGSGKRWVWYSQDGVARLWTGGTDRLSLNQNGSMKVSDLTADNVEVTGTLTQVSSREIKSNIERLSVQEALVTLAGLDPVKFTYNAQQDTKPHVGFIADEAPELVATADRTGVVLLDIIAVLTKVVQDQQQAIVSLCNRLDSITRDDLIHCRPGHT